MKNVTIYSLSLVLLTIIGVLSGCKGDDGGDTQVEETLAQVEIMIKRVHWRVLRYIYLTGPHPMKQGQPLPMPWLLQ